MRISGALDDIRVFPLGPGAAAKTAVTGGKLGTGILRQGFSLPFQALGMFGGAG